MIFIVRLALGTPENIGVMWHFHQGGGGGGGGARKIRGITVFFVPLPPRGGTARKKYPTPMCKKVSQPQFFSKEHHQLLFHIV